MYDMCRCDTSAAAEASAAVRAMQCHAPVAGLLHASGILRDAPLQKQTPALIREVYAPKSVSAQALLQHAGHAEPVQHAVLFSSIAALTGPAGSANYAAANAAVDAIAHQTQNRGAVRATAQCMPCLLFSVR